MADMLKVTKVDEPKVGSLEQRKVTQPKKVEVQQVVEQPKELPNIDSMPELQAKIQASRDQFADSWLKGGAEAGQYGEIPVNWVNLQAQSEAIKGGSWEDLYGTIETADPYFKQKYGFSSQYIKDIPNTELKAKYEQEWKRYKDWKTGEDAKQQEIVKANIEGQSSYVQSYPGLTTVEGTGATVRSNYAGISKNDPEYNSPRNVAWREQYSKFKDNPVVFTETGTNLDQMNRFYAEALPYLHSQYWKDEIIDPKTRKSLAYGRWAFETNDDGSLTEDSKKLIEVLDKYGQMGQQSLYNVRGQGGFSPGEVSGAVEAKLNPKTLSSDAKQYLSTHEGALQAAKVTGAYGLSGQEISDAMGAAPPMPSGQVDIISGKPMVETSEAELDRATFQESGGTVRVVDGKTEQLVEGQWKEISPAMEGRVVVGEVTGGLSTPLKQITKEEPFLSYPAEAAGSYTQAKLMKDMEGKGEGLFYQKWGKKEDGTSGLFSYYLVRKIGEEARLDTEPLAVWTKAPEGIWTKRDPKALAHCSATECGTESAGYLAGESYLKQRGWPVAYDSPVDVFNRPGAYVFSKYDTTSYEDEFQTDPDALLKQIPDNKGLTMLQFGFEGCGGCEQQLANMNQLLRSKYGFNNPNLHYYYIDTNSPRGNELVSSTYYTLSVPYTVLFVDGQEVQRKMGAMNPGELEYVISEKGKVEPYTGEGSDGKFTGEKPSILEVPKPKEVNRAEEDRKAYEEMAKDWKGDVKITNVKVIPTTKIDRDGVKRNYIRITYDTDKPTDSMVGVCSSVGCTPYLADQGKLSTKHEVIIADDSYLRADVNDTGHLSYIQAQTKSFDEVRRSPGLGAMYVPPVVTSIAVKDYSFGGVVVGKAITPTIPAPVEPTPTQEKAVYARTLPVVPSKGENKWDALGIIADANKVVAVAPEAPKIVTQQPNIIDQITDQYNAILADIAQKQEYAKTHPPFALPEIKAPAVVEKKAEPSKPISDNIEDYKVAEGQYDIAGFLRDNPTKIGALIGIFSDTAIQEAKTQSETEKSLEAYKSNDGNYNLAKYLRDNPGNIDSLRSIFKEDAIQDAIAYNNQSFVKSTPAEKWWAVVKAKGGDKLTMLEFKAFLQKNPDIAKQAVSMFNQPSVKDTEAPVSLEAYTQEFMAARGIKPIGLFSIADTKEQSDARDLAVISYRSTYGENALPKSLAGTSAAFFFPPARALYPEVALKDITPVEWGLGAVMLASLGYGVAARPIFGAIAATNEALAPVITRAIESGLQGTMAGLGTTAMVMGWNDMTLGDKIVNVGFNALLFGSAAKPYIKMPERKGTVISRGGKGQFTPTDTQSTIKSVADKVTEEGIKADIINSEAITAERSLSPDIRAKLERAQATPEEILSVAAEYNIPENIVRAEFERHGYAYGEQPKEPIVQPPVNEIKIDTLSESFASELNAERIKRTGEILDQTISTIYQVSEKLPFTEAERRGKVADWMEIEERLGRQHETEVAIVDKMNPDFPSDEGILRYEDNPDGLNIKEITSESNDFARQRDYIEALAAYILKKAIEEKRTIKIDTTVSGGSELLRVLQNVPFADIVEDANGISTIKFNLGEKKAAPTVRLSDQQINEILAKYRDEKAEITKALNQVTLALKEGNRPLLIKAGRRLQQLAEGHPEVPGYVELARQGRLLQAIPDEYLSLTKMFKEKGVPTEVKDAVSNAEQAVKDITQPEGGLRRGAEKAKKEEIRKRLDEWKRQQETPKPEQKRTQVITKTALQFDLETLLKQVEEILQKETKPGTKVDIEKLLEKIKKQVKEKEKLTSAEIEALVAQLKKVKEEEYKTKPVLKPMPATTTKVITATEIETKAQPRIFELPYPQTQPKPWLATEPLPLTIPKSKEKEQTRIRIEPMVQQQSQPQVKPEAKPEVKSQTKTKPQTETEVVTKTKTPIKIETRVIPPIIVKTPEGKERELTQPEIEGAIAWKQGFMFKMLVPPYGQNDIINTRKAIPGVKYYKGVGSAAASIVTKYGDIPLHIRRDMGIVDIDIFRSLDKNKPRMRFKADAKQKTKYSGIVTTGEQ